MDADGSRQTPVTNGPYDWHPLITADGRSVCFVRLDQPDHPLYLAPIEGGPPTLLAGPASPGQAAPWQEVPAGFRPHELSPDGSWILGAYDDNQHRRRLAVVPATGEGPVRKVDIELQLGASGGSYAWASDGRAVTFIKTTEGVASLWRQPIDHGPAVRLASYPLTAVLLGVTCGVAVGGVAFAWKGGGAVAAAIAVSITLSMITACGLGVVLPTALRAARRDPRIASGPIVLATADLATLLFYFNLAGGLLT